MQRQITISPGGGIRKVAEPGDEQWLPEAKLRRASYITPANAVLRVVFKLLRLHVHDASKAAAWTRQWRCRWRVEIVGGPTLPAVFTNRQEAIAAEIAYLESR